MTFILNGNTVNSMSKQPWFKRHAQLFWLSVIVLLVLVGSVAVRKRAMLLERFRPEKSSTTQGQSEQFAMAQSRSYGTEISLPQPKKTGGIAVEQAIMQRRSKREFTSEAVSMAALSQMLWSAQGITDPATGHRAAPSAREGYPLTVFVVVRNVAGLEPGLYEYLPKTHALGDLKLKMAGDQLNSSGVQPGAQKSPVVFLITADYGKAQKVMGASAKSSSLIEVGHVAENMYLQAESLKMGMVTMAGFDPAKVGAALSLDPAESVVYVIPFGHPAPEKAAVLEGVTGTTVLGASTEVGGGTETGGKSFSSEELATYNGKNGQKIYFAYKGKVYDATESREWKEGEHYGLQAGADLTGKLGEAPHGEEVLTKLPVVGTYGKQAEMMAASPEAMPQTKTYQWYYVAGAVVLVVILGLATKMVFSQGGKKTGKKSK